MMDESPTYDLQLDSLAVELDGSDFLLSHVSALASVILLGRCTYEVDTNGRNVGFSVRVVGES